jgi:hypothetical protein
MERQMATKQEKTLTCTNYARTLYEKARGVDLVDATARKLVETLATLRRQIASLQEQEKSIKLALESTGLRSKKFGQVGWWPDGCLDDRYALDQPFKEMTLVNTCKKILSDSTTFAFTKDQIEYLAVVGGYPFLTEDRKNSVDVTMRRLAQQEFCQIIRGKGQTPNQYTIHADKGMKMLIEQVMDRREAYVERRKLAASTKNTRKH